MSTLKIVSDGTSQGTHVYDKEGNEIANVLSVKVDIDSGQVTALLRVAHVEAELAVHSHARVDEVFVAGATPNVLTAPIKKQDRYGDA